MSGYMYHSLGSEAWLGLSFSDADTACNWRYLAPIVEAPDPAQESVMAEGLGSRV